MTWINGPMALPSTDHTYLADTSSSEYARSAPARRPDDITIVCGECGGHGCKKCNYTGTVTIVE